MGGKGKHGSPRTGGYRDPLKLVMLPKSLEPPGFPFCHLSGNPVESIKYYRGRRLGESRFRGRHCGWSV